MLKTIAIAFSMFSKIKMPQFDWEEKNMKYLLVAFPIVGLAVAMFVNIFVLLCDNLGFSSVFGSIGCVIIPIIATGGIHLDGLADTSDALASNLSQKRKLEILSDPHIGAFGVIAIIIYFFASFMMFYELNWDKNVIFFIFLIFFVSRTISSLTLLKVSKAKKDGLGSLFASTNDKKIVFNTLCVFLFISFTMATLISFKYAIFITFSCIITVLWWFRLITPKFGGTTGDLQGYLLQYLELFMILAIVLAQKVV